MNNLTQRKKMTITDFNERFKSFVVSHHGDVDLKLRRARRALEQAATQSLKDFIEYTEPRRIHRRGTCPNAEPLAPMRSNGRP